MQINDHVIFCHNWLVGRKCYLLTIKAFFHKRKLSAIVTAKRDKFHESLAKTVA